MKRNIRFGMSALLVVLLLSMAFVPAVSAQPNKSSKMNANEHNPVFEFESITNIEVNGAVSISELMTNGIQNPNELNIPPSVKKYDVVTFNQVELNNKIKKILPIRIRGEKYNIELNRMNFENIDDGINSYEGKLAGVDNSEVVLTTSDKVTTGRVTINNETFWIRPIEPRNRFEKGKLPLHIIYSSNDVESPKSPVIIDNGTIGNDIMNAPHTQQSEFVVQQDVTIQSYTAIGLLVATDNQFYQDEIDWKATAQGIIADANNQYHRSDIMLDLWVMAYDDSKRLQLSNDANIKSDPLGTFKSYFPPSYLNGKSSDIAIYLGGYDATGYANGAAWGYDANAPFDRYAWAQMVRDFWGYDGSDHGRRVVTIHEIGHMLDAEHENTGGFSQAYNWQSQYTVMWSTYKGNNGLYEFSSLNYNGDSTHDNARSIRAAKDVVKFYV